MKEPEQPAIPLNDPEAAELIAQLEAYKQELKKSTENLASSCKLTPAQLRTFLQQLSENHPQCRAVSEQISLELWKEVRPDLLNRSQRAPITPNKNSQKQKNIGLRRKNWIQMP